MEDLQQQQQKQDWSKHNKCTVRLC